MSHRFQIQEIVAQDLSGVVFHAVDAETGKPVAVRRFFPFGVDGGGLIEEECVAYQSAVEQLARIEHPGLRAVLAGGCDPVDGMPFVATEWIEGESLSGILERGVLAPAAAFEVLDRLLELSETLSQVLGSDEVWLDTSLSMILMDGTEQGRGCTFCISPLKWLGLDTSKHSLLVVAGLAEELLGWRGRIVSDQAGGGLGAWVKWLRVNSETITLFQAREGLAKFTGGTIPEPAKEIAQAMRLPMPLKRNSSKRPLIIIAALVLLIVVAGWWLMKLPVESSTGQATPANPQNPESKRLAEVNARAMALSKAIPQPEPNGTSRVFQFEDSNALINEKGREVTVEGALQNVRLSNSGKTLYLEFSKNSPADEVRGSYRTENADAEMSVQSLLKLIDKRIRICGVVEIKKTNNTKRPEVILKGRLSIKEAR